MKICMNEESIKACELSEENCFDCSYGKVFSVLRRTDAELVELAGNAFEHIDRLARIQETLWLLEENCSRISKSDKAVLSDSAFKISWSAGRYFQVWCNAISEPFIQPLQR